MIKYKHTPATETFVVRESISIVSIDFCLDFALLRALTTVGKCCCVADFGVLSNLAVTNCVILLDVFDLRNGNGRIEWPPNLDGVPPLPN